VSERIWLEVALNGPWGKRGQPLCPTSVSEIVAEGVACVQEGASIVHMHAFDVEADRQLDCADTYTRIIEGIRERVDAIVYPTIAIGEDRFAVVEQLTKRKLLEWMALDSGSVNIEPLDGPIRSSHSVYANPPRAIQRGFSIAAEYGIHPAIAAYEPGFVRSTCSWTKRLSSCPAPIFRVMFSNEYTFGLPPADYAFRAWRQIIDDLAPGAPLMVAGLGIDTFELLPQTLDIDAHIRVGLEDMPRGCRMSNVSQVRRMAEAIRARGKTLASVDEVRAGLAR